MTMFGKEYWIWTELLAFDNVAEDQGVEAYIQRVGRVPDGIALMLSHQDFVYLHKGMETEYVLDREYCSRNAHERNGIRHRQNWTNYQLRALVTHLKQRGIKVFLSLFKQSLNSRFPNEYFHKEYHSEYTAYMFCDIEDDGRDFSEVFAEKLRETMLDYGFNGWHGADGCMSGGWFMTGGWPHVRQKMFELFCKLNGIAESDIPEQFRAIPDADMETRKARSAWVWDHYARAWQKFMTKRWVDFHARTIETLHSIGCEEMLNSCEAKSIFEAGFYFGLDTRGFAQAKLDYLLVESVATSCNLIYGTEEYPERAHQVYCCVQELAAGLPDMKLITMTGVCDPVESFNSIRHTPTMLERDIYCCANQSIMTAKGEKRCADGALVCLGDNLEPDEWRHLWEYFKESVDFPSISTEGYTWLYSDAVQDNMAESYTKYGTLPPYLQTCELAYRGVMLSCICRSENMGMLEGRPLFVPDADLLPESEWERVKARKDVTVLLCNLDNITLPTGARVAVKTDITQGYTLGLVVLNGKEQGEVVVVGSVKQDFDLLRIFRSVQDPMNSMTVNEEFWKSCADVMKAEVFHPLKGQGFAIVKRMSPTRRRIAIASEIWHYFVPEFLLDKDNSYRYDLKSSYVCTDLEERDGKLTGKGARHIFNLIFVPPKGLFLFEEETEKEMP